MEIKENFSESNGSIIYEDFSSYSKEIEEKTSEIPENNLLFWGSWFCEGLLQRWRQQLYEIDETYYFDETDCHQKEMFELIVSLDEVLSYCQSGERGFEFSISQSIINVIDIMLQDEDKDILSKEGFQDALVQNEVKAQFEMISLLKEKKLTSEFKHWLRK